MVVTYCDGVMYGVMVMCVQLFGASGQFAVLKDDVQTKTNQLRQANSELSTLRTKLQSTEG